MKLFVIEEHHEAFPIWFDNQSPSLPKTLLHVDAHSDMFLPVVKKTFRAWKHLTKENIISTTIDQLHINDFIAPALYLGIFNRICWIRPEKSHGDIINETKKVVSSEKKKRHNLSDFLIKSERMAIKSLRSEGKQLFFYKNTNHANMATGDSRYFQWEIYCQHSPSSKSQNVEVSIENLVLDIEFDYFFCNPNPCIRRKIEISRQEFLDYKSDPYHFLRLHYRTQVYEQNGSYYLEFNPWAEDSKFQNNFKESDIEKTVISFTDWLSTISIKPFLITLCRAERSGFCPKPAVPIIEEVLISKLKELYDFDIIFP